MSPDQKALLKQHILGLVKFFESKGYDIKPYPKVVFSEDNDSNSITSPTGHYKSETNTITLYCNGRHPKDALNTFSHELWHKHQDVRGDLDPASLGLSTSYSEGSDHLKAMEEEAYKMGNVLRREYTESLQK